MKCLQCGTELDRLSKWRGSSEYCSEECKKKSQEEFNRLAMNRLMQPRPIRTSARAAAAAIRTVESSAGRLTMVTHPPGASSPLVTEPPEAGFLMEASATLAELQLRYQPHEDLSPGPPRIPESPLPSTSALSALEEIVRGLRPPLRPARRLSGLLAAGPNRALLLALPPGAPPVNQLPECSPVWPDSLGIDFAVAGLEDIPVAPVRMPPETTLVTAPVSGAPVLTAPQPVSHRAIPSRRSALDLPALPPLTLGEERLIPVPPLSSPRLRIHLPKPTLQTYRPQFAFAPRTSDGEASSVSTAPATKPASEREERRPKESNRQRRAREAAKNAGVRSENKTASSNGSPAAKVSPIAAPPEREVAEQTPVATQPPEPAVSPVQPAAVEIVTENKGEPQPIRESKAAEADVPFAPSFGGAAEAEPEGFWARIPGWQKIAAAVVVIGLAVGAWAFPALREGPPRRTAPSPAAAWVAENWELVPAADATGKARNRTINRYKMADGKRDYVLEFTGQIDQRAMGWVFRMKDARNYYCLKLEKNGDGPAAGAQLVKFAVVDGQEQPHRLASLQEPLIPGVPIKIRLRVQGQNFTTEVNGKPADVWIDSQIGEGTVGFSNESGERAAIRAAKVTF